MLVEDLFDGIYAISDATTQEEYDAPFSSTSSTTSASSPNSRFLFSDEITDWRHPAVRVADAVRRGSAQPSAGVAGEYLNLWEYARDLYQAPAVHSRTPTSRRSRRLRAGGNGDPNGIVPGGPDTAGWQVPADRSALSPVHEQR